MNANHCPIAFTFVLLAANKSFNRLILNRAEEMQVVKCPYHGHDTIDGMCGARSAIVRMVATRGRKLTDLNSALVELVRESHKIHFFITAKTAFLKQRAMTKVFDMQPKGKKNTTCYH